MKKRKPKGKQKSRGIKKRRAKKSRRWRRKNIPELADALIFLTNFKDTNGERFFEPTPETENETKQMEERGYFKPGSNIIPGSGSHKLTKKTW